MIARYFAYGSNMNPARMADRGLATLGRPRAGCIRGYELRFDKVGGEYPGAGHANVVAQPGSIVHGVLYDLASAQEILKMDPYERAPINYGREAIAVHTQDGALWSWTYFANRARRAEHLRPTAVYLDHLLAGGDWLPASYLAALRAVDTVDE